jgi:predicted enzyme related to lactoylglutathione lyase
MTRGRIEGMQLPAEGTQLETVIIFTGQMENLASFYQEGLRLGPFESPGHLGQRVEPVYLGFDQDDEAEAGSGGGATLWFTVDDLQATFDRLVAMGAEVRYPPTEKPWGACLACVYDLDGNVLGLVQRRLSAV